MENETIPEPPARFWTEIQGTPEQKLAFLIWHWGDLYSLSRAGGRWRAARLDNGEACEAESAEELRDAIRADNTTRPVPRFR